jgi:hypothetical protein
LAQPLLPKPPRKWRPSLDKLPCWHQRGRTEAAAVRAIASGSQHKTMSATSHRIARSLSVSAPTSSATYRIGAVSASIRRLCATSEARSALRAARVAASRFRSSTIHARAPCCASMMDIAPVVLSRRVASAIASRPSSSATTWVTSSVLAASRFLRLDCRGGRTPLSRHARRPAGHTPDSVTGPVTRKRNPAPGEPVVVRLQPHETRFA